ncbi:MAG TPA: Fic family protein [Nitrososphaerales archaeon]|nr:Fic family protein [Nitrososphaerales archaeon]
MGKRTVHHVDFEAVVGVNREVVALTGEPCEYSTADGKKLSELVKEVELRADNQEFQDAVTDKASLLVFKTATGQHFRAGNKRTALVLGLVFLRKNGYTVNIQDTEFVSAVDKAGMGAAGLDELYSIVRRMIKKSPVERKGWEKVVKEAVASNRKFLTEAGA